MTGWGGTMTLAGLLLGSAVLLAAAPGPAAPRRVRRLASPRLDGDASGALDRRPRRRRPIESRVEHRLQPLARGAVTAARGARRRFGRPPDEAFDRRLAAAGAAGVVAGSWHPVLGLAVGLAVWGSSWARARSAARRRLDELVDEVPDLVELFRLAVAAGLTVHLAVGAVSSRFGGVLGEGLALVSSRVGVGERLADALDAFADCGEPVRPLATALAAAERYGDPLAPVLERLSIEARTVRRRHAEEAARRLPVQLLFPLVLCVLPAFVLLAVAPLLLATVPQLPR